MLLLFQGASGGEEEAEDVNSHLRTQREREEDLFTLPLNAPQQTERFPRKT